MKRLEGKVALITGSTAGMGRESAKVFAQEGAKVVVTGRRQERVDELVAWGKENGLEISGIAADVLDPASAEKLVNFTMEQYGKIDGSIPKIV